MQELSDSQFLEFLRQRAIDLHVRDGRLQVNSPAGTVDPALRAELARRKPALLAVLGRSESLARPHALTPAQRGSRIPQTQAQQGMWLIDHFAPGNTSYNIPEAFLIAGPIEMSLLQLAIDGLLQRHETLRTRFYEEDGELLQQVLPHAEAPVGFTDLSTTKENNSQDRLHAHIQELARLPFDLDQPPLVRFHLFRLDAQRYVIFLNIHHIIADRRSLEILRAELEMMYRAAAAGQATPLANLPIQFSDYAIWFDMRLKEGAWKNQIHYWQASLAGAPPFLELPAGRPYPERRTSSGAIVPVRIPGPLQRALSEIARQERATMFMTLLALFAVLVNKISAAEDFCIGSPFTHRNQVETENLIGLFVNMLVLRCRLDGERSFREVVRSVRLTALDAFDNSDVPFQELVRALKPDLRSQRSPLFQVMFAFDAKVESRRSDHEPSNYAQIDTHPGTARFELSLQLAEVEDGIAGAFEYSKDVFDPPDIERMAAQFASLAQQVADRPDVPISALALSGELPGNNADLIVNPEPQREAPSAIWTGRIKKLFRK